MSDIYHVSRHGAIVDEDEELLYESHALLGLSCFARNRLAEIHTQDSSVDWEGAREILIAEGLMKEGG